MSSTNATELERTLLRSGDDLYRLSLLLSDDEASAAQALIKATRRLVASGSAPDQPALIAALLQALPPERRRWRGRLPAWARPRFAPAARTELLQALAALPRAQRFALGLTMLCSFETTQAAALLGDEQRGAPSTAQEAGATSQPQPNDSDRTRAVVRDALLAVAPVAAPSMPAAALDSASAPEECRPTRTAIALNDPALHNDPAIRGHLALCSACRAAEHAWQSLSVAVEEALRGALRETRLPAALADQLHEASQPAAAATGRALLASPRTRLALVSVPVLVLIALLVWPRGVPSAPTASAPPLAQAPKPLDLVRRARDQLYIPPAGQGVWHGHYEIQWAFADDSAALLAGDAWIDSAGGRHRIQLVHHSGGGPYEFELADGKSSVNYAVSPNYQPSLYPLSYNLLNRVKIEAAPEAQIRMLAARFQSAAWGIAGAYLRQAEQAELRAWGRQRDNDGALLDLVSFSGISPLALPADAPNATSSRVTVLLAINEATGRLREVRELIGPAGSEQTTRITWRQVSEEWIDSDETIRRTFDLVDAWNGIGNFTAIGKLVDPALPLARPEAVTGLVSSYQLGWTGLLMPSAAPAGTSSAFLLSHNPSTLHPGEQPDASTRLTFVYLAPGRRLEISTGPGATPSLVGGEIVLLDQRQFLVQPGNGQAYQAQFDHNLDNTLGSASFTTQVAALGYTRAELLDVLRTLGSPTLAAYVAQARLFANPGQHDREAFEALLTALAPTSPDAPRHFVERVFKRQNKQPDQLPDPYHRPLYSGWPEQVLQDNWERGGDGVSAAEHAATTKGDDGTIYGRQYLSPSQVWFYDALASSVDSYSGGLIGADQRNNEDQSLLIRLIACGGGTLHTGANGQRTIVLTEQNWRNGGSCMHPEYAQFFYTQTVNDPNSQPDQTPYLADRTEEELTTLVELNAEGRNVKIQTWAGAPEVGTLLQSWELISSEAVPAERVPAATFDANPPAALQRRMYRENGIPRPLPYSVTITQALALAQTPLFVFPTAAVTETATITSTGQVTATRLPSLDSIMAGPPPNAPGTYWDVRNAQNVFEQALRDGFAVRFSYRLPAANGSSRTVNLYQWPAQTLGAYLRGSAIWKSSEAATLQIGGKQISSWHVVERSNDAEWLLFELDNTLIATDSVSFEWLDALRRLQPVTRGG